MIDLDLKTLTDEELLILVDQANKEYETRRVRVDAAAQMRALGIQYLQASGVEAGDEYVTPTGYYDAYPKGWKVRHNDAIWESLRDGAIGVPGESPDWRQIPEDGETLDWVQPHAGGEYLLGDKVRFDGYIWENELEANGFIPTAPHSGWKIVSTIEEHDNPEPEPEPDPEPETPGIEYTPWVQPSAGTEYAIGAIVSHNGHLWENTYDRNGWEPGQPHSQWTDLGPIE